jgi:moderate conductance mechanosensitive channel
LRLLRSALVFCAAAALYAQAPPDLSDEDLVRRAVAEVAAFRTAADASNADEAAIESDGAALRAAFGAASAPKPAAPPDPTTRPAPIPEAELLEIVKRHEAYAKALEDAARAGDEALKLADARQRLLAAAGERLKVAEAAAASARPFLIEIKRRVEGGRLAADKVALHKEEPSAEQCLARVEAAEAKFPAFRKKIEDEIARVAETKASLAAAAASRPAFDPETLRAKAAASFLAEALKIESTERDALGKTPPSEIASVSAKIAEDLRRAEATREAARAEAAAAIAELEAKDLAVKETTAPDRASIPEGEGHAELKQARREVAFRKRMVDYRAARAEALMEADKAATAVGEALNKASAADAAAAREAARMLAATRLGATLVEKGTLERFEPPGGSIEELATYLRDVASARADDRVLSERAAERLRSDADVEAAERELASEKQDLARAESALREEETYAGHLEEMARRSPEELSALLAQDGAIARDVAAARTAVEEAVKARDAAEAKTRNLRDVVRAVENPHAEAGIRRARARAEEIRAEIEGLKDGALPEDREADPLKLPRAVEEAPEESTDADGPEKLKAAVDAEQAFAKQLVRYFADLEKATADWTTSATASDAAAETAAARFSTLVNEEKRRFACARELERRLKAGSAPGIAPPDDLASIVSREPIRAVLARRDAMVGEQNALKLRRAEESRRLAVVLEWSKWARVQSTAADRKAALVGRPVSHLASARMKISELSEADRRKIAFMAERRRADDDEPVDRYFVSWAPIKGRERFEEPLKAWYLELADGDRVAKEFGAAVAGYEEIIEVCQGLREDLTPAPAALRAAEERRVDDYRAARYLAAIAATPGKAAQVEAAFRTAYKRDLPTPIDTRGWSKRYWSDNLFAAEARLYGHRTWIRDVERQLSKLGIPAEIGRYRRQLAKISADSETAADRAHRIVADVNTIREDYRLAARKDLLVSIAKVLIVPALAWFLLRMLRRLAKRIETKAAAQPGLEGDDRTRRLSTLTSVGRAAVSGVVWALAAAYMLGAMGVDVTPFVASAGVVGLAVAFGAQTLIKDFLAGFFILLENQYTIGDVVDVGGISGVVESVGLRVTVLRDLEGTVHFVPNGTLSRISNKTQGWSRVVFEVGVAYSTNIEHATRVLEETLKTLATDLPWKFWIIEDPTVAGVERLGDSSVNIRALVKTRPGKQWDLARELRKRVKNAFDAAGIEIPFPQRTVHHVYENGARSTERAIGDDATGGNGAAAEAADRAKPEDARA